MGLLDRFSGSDDKENVAQPLQGKADAYGQAQQPFGQQNTNASYGQQGHAYGQQGQAYGQQAGKVQQEEKEGWSSKQKVSWCTLPDMTDRRLLLVWVVSSPLAPLPVPPLTVSMR